jgi:hypothetical protein
VDQLEGVTPHPLLGFVAQNPLDRRAHVAEGAASVAYHCREIKAEFAQLKAVEGFPEYGFVDGLEPKKYATAYKKGTLPDYERQRALMKPAARIDQALCNIAAPENLHHKRRY